MTKVLIALCLATADGYRHGSRGQGDAANDAGPGGNRRQRGHADHGGVPAG